MSSSNDPLPLIPAVTDTSGDHGLEIDTAISWRYQYRIDSAGTASEVRSGDLFAPGVELSKAQPGDRVQTPWGVMQFAGGAPDRGWLLQFSRGRPIDPSAGKLLQVPAAALARGGVWKGAVAPWEYTVQANAVGSKSERRIGQLRHRHLVVLGNKQGDVVKTPWGAAHWMGPVDPEARSRYEQGFLLLGAHDRPLQTGEVFLVDEAVVEHRLSSEYLAAPASIGPEQSTGHRLRLDFVSEPRGSMHGTLTIDPNSCTLNAFGDPEGCTKMGLQTIPVTISPLRLADPAHLGRWCCQVHGDRLGNDLALIIDPVRERYVLKHGPALVPLFLERH